MCLLRLIRDAAGRLAFGESVLDAARTYLGSALGPMRGRDGNVHRGKPREGYLPMNQPSRRDDFCLSTAYCSRAA